MFERKTRCKNCSKDVSKKFDYCPFCASPLKDLKKEYGMLGRTDDIGEFDRLFNKAFSDSGIASSSLFNKMLASTMKMLQNEARKMSIDEAKTMHEIQNEAKIHNNSQNPNMKTNFELYINGKKVNLPGNIAGIQIEKMPKQNGRISKSAIVKKIPNNISEELLKKASKLPRKEAKSHVSRTSDKVIYELETPGLNSLNNVLVNKLDSSIEIRAYTEKAVYFKTLPGKLPLMKYSMIPNEGKLVLEFKA